VLEYLAGVSIAPVTSMIRDIPSEVLLTSKDGLPRNCAVNLDYVQTVSRSRLGPLIATLSAGRMREIRSALLFAHGF
jgi:mRNA interferase MazF